MEGPRKGPRNRKPAQLGDVGPFSAVQSYTGLRDGPGFNEGPLGEGQMVG
jgi:hypothetical protein